MSAGSLKASAFPPLHVVAVASADTKLKAEKDNEKDKEAESSNNSVIYWSLDNRRLFTFQQWAKACPVRARVWLFDGLCL